GDAFEGAVRRLRDLFDDDRLSVGASFAYGADDDERVGRLATIAASVDAPLVATNDAHFHHPDRRMLQDVLTCIRHGCTLSQAGLRLFANAERHLKPPEEMARLFRP